MKPTKHNLLNCGFAVLLACVTVGGDFIPANAQGQGPDAVLISDQSGITINDISLSGHGIHLFISLPPDMGQPTFLERLLKAMTLSMNAVPRADLLVVHLFYLDEPFGVLEVTANKVKQINTGTIDGSTFLEAMEFMDQRSPERQMSDNLYELGFNITQFDFTEQEVFLSYIREPYADKLTLFEDWQFILNLVLNLFPGVERTNIHVFIPENETELMAEINMRDYEDFQKDDLNLLEFFARIETSYAMPELNQSVKVENEEASESKGSLNIWMILCAGGMCVMGLVVIGVVVFLVVSKKKRTI